jgi:hypothetical protein
MSRFSAVFAGFLALFVYLAIFPYLIGFDFHFWQQTKVLGVVWCILFLPLLIKKDNKEQNWWLTPSLQTIFLLFLLGAIGYVCRWWQWLIWIAWLLAVVGVILFVYNSFVFWKQTTWKQKIIFLGLSFIFGNYLVGQIYTHALSPIYEANLAFYRGGIPDILDASYHSSVSQMLQTYNVLTTGLDGLVSMNYNIIVHYLFAQLALFFSTSVLYFFNLVYPVLMFPLFFYTFLSLSNTFYQRLSFYLQKPSNYILFHFSSSFVLFFIFFPLPDSIYARGLLGYHFVQAPIYTTALVLLFTITETAINYIDRPIARKTFDCFFLPVALFIAAYAQVSIGVALLTGIGYVWLLEKRWKMLYGWIWIVLHIVILFFCYWLTAETKPGIQYSYEGRLNWFFFFRQEGFNGVEFVWGMYSPLILVVCLALFWLKLSFSLAPTNKFLHYILALCLIALAGLSPNVLLELYGSTGMYFMSIQRFLAGSFLMAMLSFVNFHLPYKQVLKVSTILGMILLIYMPFRNTLNEAWKTNIDIRKEITGIKDFHWKANHFVEKIFSNDADWVKAAILFDENIEQKAMQNAFFAFIRKLKQLNEQLTLSEKSKSLLYLPYHQLNFLYPKNEKWYCIQIPIYLTATSGIALLKGLPHASCTENVGAYGYSYYNYEDREKVWQVGYSVQEAFSHTRQKGFQILWYYDTKQAIFQKVVF